jgi:hypothetical protein
MCASRGDLREYVVWLQGFPWQLFATFSFVWRVSDGQAAQVFKTFINRLEKSLRCPIVYIRGDEKRYSGCGKPAAPRHFHLLMAAAIRLDANYIANTWMRMAGFRADGAGAKVCTYDSKGNAIAYCLKFIFQPDGDWDFKNLDLYLCPPNAMNKNRRQRRRLARQAHRKIEAPSPIESGTPRLADLDSTDRGSKGLVTEAESFSQLCSLERAWRKGKKMTKAKMALKGNGLAAGNGRDNLVKQARARDLDQQIRAKRKEVDPPLIELGRLMARMRESELWKYLPIRYHGWEDYFNDVMGPRSRSTIHEIAAAFSLTEGSNPIPPEDVIRMGRKKAAQIARLKPEQRTPEIREMAKTEPVMVVRNRVQAVLNQELPADEQKPMLKLLAINLPEELVLQFEELMEDGIWMVGIRDGDDTQTMRAKVFGTMLISFQEYMAPELAEGMKHRKAKEGIHDSPAASAQEDSPEEDEGHDFSDDE